jgi:outer membrane protein TolC
LGLTSVFAQTPAIPRIDFDTAIERALENNPTLVQAATAITRADLLVRQAQTATRPTVTAGFTNTTLDRGIAFEAGSVQPQNQSTFSGTASLSLLNLAGWAAVGQARDQVQIAELSTETTRRDIAVVTAQTYLAVIATQRQIEVDQRAVDTARAHLEYADRRLEAGAGSRLNQARAATSLSIAELRLENSRLALRQAQEALGVLVAADSPVDAAGEPAFDLPAAISEADWMQARPDVRREQATRRATERVVQDSWRDWIGTASAAFTPQFITPAGLFQPSRTWRLNVSFVQPVFEGGRRKAALALRELQVEQARLALSHTVLLARSEVRLAQAAVESAQRALASAQTAAGQAIDVLQITTSAFEVGATTNIEVIDAQRSARDAETTAAVAEDALRRARLELLVAIGQFPK